MKRILILILAVITPILVCSESLKVDKLRATKMSISSLDSNGNWNYSGLIESNVLCVLNYDKSKIIIYSTDIQEYDVVSVDVQQKGNKISFKCIDKEGLKCGITLKADSSNDEIIDITIYYTDMIIYYRTRVI